jgi:hypothetical protein
LDAVKEESQQTSANEEVTSTLNDESNASEQNYLKADIPLPRVEALFDMGW